MTKKQSIHKKENSLQKQWARDYRRHKWRWVRRTVVTVVCSGMIGITAVLGYYYASTPKLTTVFRSATNTRLFQKQVNVVYLNSEGKRFYQTNDSDFQAMQIGQTKTSKNVVNALVATEDRDFFKEDGVNWLHTIKATLDTFVGHNVVGGSTITQQLIKQAFFSTKQSDQTIKRKVQEMVLANQLSKKYSKYQILTWYLNKVDFSNGQTGLRAAAKYYYGKTPQNLTKLEAATLVGIVNSPSMYNPYLYKAATQKRRNLVLQSMYEAGYISKQDERRLRIESINTGLKLGKTNVLTNFNKREAKLKYNGFVSATNAQLNRYDKELTSTTVTIRTTMSQHLQDKVRSIVQHQKYPDKMLEEALVVLDNRNGNVLAMSGGRQQTVLGGYNRAFNGRRSSGSSIKPLLDYAPGFDLYGWTGSDIVHDTRYHYPGTNTEVHNWDNRHQGSITLRQALIQSRNIPAVKALAKVGLPKGKQALQALGLPNDDLYYANAIGIDTSPLAMASAYSALANNGTRANARFVTQLKNSATQGHLNTQTVKSQVFKPMTAYKLSNILKGVFKGSGTAVQAKVNGINEAGKTGTVGRGMGTQTLTDGWMIGYTKGVTVAVWVGYDNPYDKHYVLTNKKAEVAQSLYKSVMQQASIEKGHNNSDWHKPTNKPQSDFTDLANRRNGNLPFLLNETPGDFLDRPDNATLTQIYRQAKKN